MRADRASDHRSAEPLCRSPWIYFDADGLCRRVHRGRRARLGPRRGQRPRSRSGEFMASGTYDLRKMNFAPAQTPDGREWPSTVRHLVTNQVIEIDGDSARGISYWMNYGNNADRRKIEWLSFGSWDDRVREDRGPVVLQAPHDLQRRQPQPLHGRPTQPAAELTSVPATRHKLGRPRLPTAGPDKSQ